MGYTGLGNLLSCGNTEFYFRVPKDSCAKEAMRRIHCHVRRMRSKCSTAVIYGCNENGEGVKIIHIVLDEPIVKKPRGKRIVEDKTTKKFLT